MQLEIPTPSPYDFEASVRAHGWYQLAPFRWDDARRALERVERLASGRVVLLHLAGRPGHVAVRVDADGGLSGAEAAEIEQKARWMLKFDEDLTPFYAVARRHPHLWAKLAGGGGRLLRCPTFFEDVVKTICTTNTTWRMTINMVERIVDRLGDPYPLDPARRAFPTAAQVMAAGDALFDEEIRLGYRNEYVRTLAREVALGERPLETLKTAGHDGQALRKQLKSIKGVGDYAANTLLMVLGFYDELPVDSEFRSLVGRKYFDGQTPSIKEMTAVYDDFGRWKYLAYWFDEG